MRSRRDADANVSDREVVPDNKPVASSLYTFVKKNGGLRRDVEVLAVKI